MDTNDGKKALKRRMKMQEYKDVMDRSAAMMLSMGASAGRHDACSWEGVMTMLADVQRRGSADEKAAAFMFVASWVWAHCEHRIHEKMHNVLCGAPSGGAVEGGSDADAGKPEGAPAPAGK